MPAADRLPNPASRLPDHNNGVVCDLPAPPSEGAGAIGGVLRLGVGRDDIGSAGVLRLGGTGLFTTLYAGRAYPDSIIDSGTEADIVPDDRLPRCEGLSWAFCIVPDRRFDAVMVGRDGTQLPMSFTVGRYRGAGASGSDAVAADPRFPAFVWGAPFFLGRRVAAVIAGRSVPDREGSTGPLYAVGPAAAP